MCSQNKVYVMFVYSGALRTGSTVLHLHYSLSYTYKAKYLEKYRLSMHEQ